MLDELNELINLSSELSEYESITTKELKELGFTEYRIKKLSSGEEPILLRPRRGHYVFNPKILRKIDSLQNIKQFRIFIEKKEYENAILIIKPCDIEYFEEYDYLFLYLLSYSVEIPEELRHITKNLDIESILNNPNNQKLQKLNDDIKSNLISRHFGKARIFLIHQEMTLKEEKTLDRVLLTVQNKRDRTNKSFASLFKENKYQEVLSILNNFFSWREPTTSESYLKKLIETLLNIKNTGIIPNEITTENADFFENIDNNNFKRALSVSKNQVFTKPLEDIITLIDKIKEEQETRNMQTSENEKAIEVTLEDILTALTLKEQEKASKLIRLYLRKIKKEEYTKLVINLVQISFIENDIAFIVPMKTLISLKNGTFTPNKDLYLYKFKEAINSLCLYEASIYLEILRELQRLGLSEIKIQNLEHALTSAKKERFNPENSKHLSYLSSLMVKKCLSLEEVCALLKLNNDTKNIIFLMYAKEYYYLKDYMNGDKLVNIVEREKDKSPRVKELIREIRRDKNYYTNRIEEIGASLILGHNI